MIRILLALALVFAAVIGWELSGAGADFLPAPPAPAAAASDAAAIAPPSPDPTQAGWTEPLLARPLFSPDRRAAEQKGTTVRGADMPRLSGVIISGDNRRVVFAAPGAPHPLVLREGEKVGPFLITAIAPDGVRLTGPGGPQTMRPAFSTQAARSPPPPPPVATPQQAADVAAALAIQLQSPPRQ